MARVLVVVLGVLMVVSSGCAMAGLSESGTTETTTQAATPSPTPTPADGRTPNETPAFPPGVSGAGIDNGTRLLETHWSILANRTYAEQLSWDEGTSRVDENGTHLGFEVESYRKTVTNGPVATHVSMRGEGLLEEFWMTDGFTASKRRLPDGNVNGSPILRYYYVTNDRHARTVSRVQRAPLGGIDGVSGLLLEKYLNGLDYEHAGTVTRDGHTLHTFTSTGINESGRTPVTISSDSLDRVNVTVIVDERGIIHTLDVSEVYTGGNDTMTLGMDYTVRDIGDAAATRPDWVTSRIPHFRASLAANGTIVELSHTGGMPITRGVSLYLSTPDRSAHTLVPGAFEPGETWYLYLMENATDRISGSRNDRPVPDDSFVALGGESVSLRVQPTGTSESGSVAVIHMEVNNGTSTRSTSSSFQTDLVG